VLGKLARQHDPNVLVGFDHADDAGVYRIGPETALVQTVDFFTPIVDDPYTFGQIAATNSLSDVYAMGGRPLTSLALVCFPEKGDLGVLEQILAGGLFKMKEAGCTVVGGHSIRDDETKFGYSVTGVVHPQKVLANDGARPGDALLLTKALGTGVISTAIKKDKAKPEWIEATVKSMTTLNKVAAEIITGHVTAASSTRPAERSSASQSDAASAELRSAAQMRASGPTWAVHGLTDITGFGLIGHAREVALASNVSIQLFSNNVPFLPGALECVQAGYIPGGLKANREFAECVVEYQNEIPEEIKTLLFDPQTAGGLLISVAEPEAQALQRALKDAGVQATRVGQVTEKTGCLLVVL
jgi:selenide, water dikinase